MHRVLSVQMKKRTIKTGASMRFTLLTWRAAFRAALAAWLMEAVLAGAAIAGPFEDANDAIWRRHDYAAALKIIRPLAEGGNPTAQYELGHLYYEGWGVPQAAAESTKWYRLAAIQGHPGAQHMLALSYEYGRGVPSNEVEALKWLRSAAEQGYGSSQYRLGEMYKEPWRWGRKLGIAQNYIEAHKWFNLSAASNHPGGAREREDLEAKMTAGQIDEAQRRAAAWRPKY
jgi:TPR repeat protein